MPEMDLNASLALLIAAALAGSFLLVLLSLMLFPGVFFALKLNGKHFSRIDITIWFVLPFTLLFVIC